MRTYGMEQQSPMMVEQLFHMALWENSIESGQRAFTYKYHGRMADFAGLPTRQQF